MEIGIEWGNNERIRMKESWARMNRGMDQWEDARGRGRGGTGGDGSGGGRFQATTIDDECFGPIDVGRNLIGSIEQTGRIRCQLESHHMNE